MNFSNVRRQSSTKPLVFPVTSEFAKFSTFSEDAQSSRQTTKKQPNIFICVSSVLELVLRNKRCFGAPMWTKNNKDVLNSLISFEKIGSKARVSWENIFCLFSAWYAFQFEYHISETHKRIHLVYHLDFILCFRYFILLLSECCHGDWEPERFSFTIAAEYTFCMFPREKFLAKIFRDIKSAPEVYLLPNSQGFLCINFNYAVRIVSIRAWNPWKSLQKKPKTLFTSSPNWSLPKDISQSIRNEFESFFIGNQTSSMLGMQSNFKQTVSFY